MALNSDVIEKDGQMHRVHEIVNSSDSHRENGDCDEYDDGYQVLMDHCRYRPKWNLHR